MQAACWKCGAAPSDGTENPTTSTLVLEPTGRLLCSNYAPLSTEIIGELQEAEECAESHVAVLSPGRRVPTDILCEIFASSLPYTRRIGEHPLEQAPWWLGHVCHHWREAALGFPFLWSSITLYADRGSSIDDTCPPMSVETQIHRSGNAPLNVSIICYDNPDFASSQSIDLLFRHSIRWDSARLHLDAAASQIHVRLALVKDKIPNLRRLEFASDVPTDVFCVAPRLCEVNLRPEADILAVADGVELPWPQITHFHGTYLRTSGALRFLGSASNIVECRLKVFRGEYPEDQHVVSGELRRLTLTASPLFFDFITTPGLQELWTSSDSPSLRDFIQRSSCQLVKLVFERCDAIDVLLSILQATPTLTTLYVAGRRMADSRILFDALKIAHDPSDLCPHLSHIAMGEIASNALDSFLDMVESRWYTASQRLSFARVFYESTSRDPGPVPRRMSQMRGEGLDIDIDFGFTPSPQNYMGAGRP